VWNDEGCEGHWGWRRRDGSFLVEMSNAGLVRERKDEPDHPNRRHHSKRSLTASQSPYRRHSEYQVQRRNALFNFRAGIRSRTYQPSCFGRQLVALYSAYNYYTHTPVQHPVTRCPSDNYDLADPHSFDRV
jgi:hypothetical protein